MKKEMFFEKKFRRINDALAKNRKKLFLLEAKVIDIDNEVEALIGKSIPLTIRNKDIEAKAGLALMIQDFLVAKNRIEKEIKRLNRINDELGAPTLSEKLNAAKWNRDFQLGNRQP